ncbi:MAG: hypothetical protein V7642_6106 [Burkholderiales bacterium]
MKRAAYPSALLLSLTLVACGGNGPDVPPVANNAPVASASESAQVAAPEAVESTPEASAEQASAVPESVEESNASTAVAAATVLYVGPNGSDSNPGTQAAPFRTIVKASQVAQPGTTVNVLPGTYAGGITTSKSGTSSARIRYVSTTKWGAKLIAPSGSTAKHGWLNTGNYVDIIGFQLDGRQAPEWRNGILTRASYGVINENYIHHLAQSVPCDNNGGSAINSTYYYYGEQIQMERNLVHDIGAKSCKFIQGIYAGTSGTIKNNLVFRVGYAAVHLWHDANGLQIANNTVADSTVGILVGGGDFYHRTVANNVHVSNNIVLNNGIGISENGKVDSSNSYFNNLAFNNRTNFSVNSFNAPTASILKDPQFKNAAANDYSLKSTSPAIGNGSPTHAPAVDFDGVKRPQGGRIDIGASEFVGVGAL